MTLTFLWLAGRLAGSVWASILQKQLLTSGTGSGRLWLATYLCLLIPGVCVFTAFPGPTGPGFWINALTAAVFDVAGNLAMASALRVTDLSIFGPLNAFRPALAGIAGWILLNEVPTQGGFAGVAIITAGAFWLLTPPARDSAPELLRERLSALAWRVLGLGLSMVGAVFLKRATLAGSPESTLGVWVVAGGGCLLATFCGVPAWRKSLRTPLTPSNRRLLALHALAFFAMQWLTLKIFQHTLLTYSFAFFQLGMVLQVILGRWIFREPDFGRRLFACALMSAGALFVLLAG